MTEAAHQLVSLTKDFPDVKAKRHAIELLEHDGDRVTHDIYERLNRTHHPPFERAEISHRATSLDEVLDYIDGSAEKMHYYGTGSSDSYMMVLAKLVHLSAGESESAVKNIRLCGAYLLTGSFDLDPLAGDHVVDILRHLTGMVS